MTQLRALKLTLDNSEDLDTVDTDILATALPKLSFLTQLGITFEGSWTFQEPTLLKFFEAFQSMKNLTDLAIDLGGCRFSYYYYEAGSILESLQYVVGTSIQKLSLTLFQNFNNENLKELSTALKGLNLLQGLSLDLFSWYKFSKEAFAGFCSALARLILLTSLSLYFPSGMTDNKIVQNIASALMSLQNLMSLKLGLRFDNGAGDQQFQTLFTNLKCLKSLKYLEIQVADQKKITDTSLEALGESLKELNSLKSVSLDFSSTPHITDKGIEALCYGIQEASSSLVRLRLKFDKNENLCEDSMYKLGKALQALVSLYAVEFCFRRCFKIAGFQGLFKTMGGMKNLEEIKLSLPYSEENDREVCSLKKRKNDLVISFFKNKNWI